MSTRLLITLSGAPLHMVGETGGSCGNRGALSLNRRHVPRRARVCLQKEGLARSLFLSDAPGYPLPGYHFPKLTHNWFGVARSANQSGKWDARLASAPRRPHIAPMPVQLPGTASSASPHFGGWRSVSQDVEPVPRPWRIRGCRVSQTPDFQAETAAGHGDDPRAQLGGSALGLVVANDQSGTPEMERRLPHTASAEPPSGDRVELI
jgi:hypothetical protein